MKSILTWVIFTSFLLVQCNAYAGLIRIPKEETETKIQNIESEFEQFSKNIQEGYKNNSGSITEINKEMLELKNKLKGLRQFILDSPEAAIQINLIQKDIKSLQEENKLIRQEISNFSGMGKWFIGTLITISLAMFGLLIPMVISVYRKNAAVPD